LSEPELDDHPPAGADTPGVSTSSELTGPGEPSQDSPAGATSAQTAGLSLPALLESLLFVADEPVTIEQLAQALESAPEQVTAALDQLASVYHEAGGRGVRLQRKGERVQLVSAPEAARAVERFLGVDLNTTLSTAAVETLAVIAYRQPLTRADIEAVRGVSCDGVLRTLISHGLVEPVGRLEQAGRPYQYGTTFQFLQYFGLESVADLPQLPEDN
jgi:segregation and condensation protein B